jgi:hypothetical protein
MRRAVLLAVSCSVLGCEPKLVVGERAASNLGAGGATGTTGTAGNVGTAGTGGTADTAGTSGSAGASGSIGEGGAAGEAGATGEGGEAGAQCPDTGVPTPGMTDPIGVPWSTGFENNFCDYTDAGGFCFGGGVRKIVTSPVHSGHYAAEFSVDSADTAKNQVRCVRQGALPSEAYYGAWYYIPVLEKLGDNSLWNLLHFQGGDTARHMPGGDSSQDGLWDVTVVTNTTDGSLQLLAFDFINGTVRRPTAPPAVPIGEWFHIQFYLKRASNATGAIRLYQNGKLLVEKTGIITDDSSWGQWYVGNIAKGLTPKDSTLYVDDVTIDTTGISL